MPEDEGKKDAGEETPKEESPKEETEEKKAAVPGVDSSADVLRETEADGEETGPEEDESFVVVVEDGGPCQKSISVEIPAEVVAEEMEKNLENIKTSMPMRGFRKGRIPKNLLVRRYGKKVREEVKSNLIGRGLVKALKDDSIEPLAYPEVDEEALTLEEDKAFKFEFVVDVKPKVTIENYVGLPVTETVASVTDEDVNTEIDAVRQRFATLEPVTEGAVEHGDHVVATLSYFLGEKKVHEEENVSLPIPKDEKSELFKVVSWIGDIIGKKPGDTLESEYKFPENFKNKKARGRKGTVKVAVEDLKRMRLPELGEEIFQALSVESEEELRDKIRTELKNAKEGEAKAASEKSILNQLLETVPIDLPERIIDKSIDTQISKAELRLRQSKVPEEEIPGKLEEMRKEQREDMVRQFKSFFITSEIARLEKIYVTEEEVQARIEMLAYNYGKWPQQMEQELEARGQMDDLRASLKEEKVLSFLRDKAEITSGEASGKKKPAKKKAAKKKAAKKAPAKTKKADKAEKE